MEILAYILLKLNSLAYKYQWTLRVRLAQRTGLIHFPSIQRIHLIRLRSYATPRFLVLMIAKKSFKTLVTTAAWKQFLVLFSTFSLVWFVHGLQIWKIFLPLFCLSVYSEIQKTHDRYRYVKGCNGRAESNVLIGQYELYVTLNFWHGPTTFYDRPQINPRWP